MLGKNHRRNAFFPRVCYLSTKSAAEPAGTWIEEEEERLLATHVHINTVHEHPLTRSRSTAFRPNQPPRMDGYLVHTGDTCTFFFTCTVPVSPELSRHARHARHGQTRPNSCCRRTFEWQPHYLSVHLSLHLQLATCVQTNQYIVNYSRIAYSRQALTCDGVDLTVFDINPSQRSRHNNTTNCVRLYP